METIDHHAQLQAALRDFLWDQWVAAGVAGHASGAAVPFIIDPEALHLATLGFAFDEARIRGEVLDWLGRNGALLSVQRMKNLGTSLPVAPPETLRALAASMERHGYRNWRTLEPLASAGADFSLSAGRGMSRALDSARPEALLPRMRMLFGVTARAEIVTWLFTHAEGHAARIARDTGWFSKSVQSILNDLEYAGMLVSRTEGKRKRVALHPRGGLWHPDLAAPLRWFPQVPFYLGIHHILQVFTQAHQPTHSPAARAIAIRRELPAIDSSFRLAGLHELCTATRNDRGQALVAQFERTTERLIDIIVNPRGLAP